MIQTKEIEESTILTEWESITRIVGRSFVVSREQNQTTANTLTQRLSATYIRFCFKHGKKVVGWIAGYRRSDLLRCGQGSLLQMPASYGRDRSKVTKTCGNLAIFVGKKRRPQRSCRRNFVILEINICATSVFQ